MSDCHSQGDKARVLDSAMKHERNSFIALVRAGS